MANQEVALSGAQTRLKKAQSIPLINRFRECKFFKPGWLATVLGFTLLSDYLIYANGPGFGWALWGVLLALFLPLCRKAKHRFTFLASIALICTCVSLAYQASWTKAILSFLMVFFVASSGRLDFLKLPEALEKIVTSCFYRTKVLVCIPIVIVSNLSKRFYLAKLNKWNLLLWGIPVLFAFIFFNFFRLANPILNEAYLSIERISIDFLDQFTFNSGEFHRIAFLMIFAWYACSALLPVTKKSYLSHKFTNLFSFSNHFFSPQLNRYQLAGNCLILLNLVFALSNGLDLYYLWIGQTLPEGVKHVEYTHQGVLWLTICVIASTIFFAYFIPKDFQEKSKSLKILAWIWVAQNLIVGLGAFKRLVSYVDFNGLTQLRVIGFIGILSVLCCLAIVVTAVIYSKKAIWVVRAQTFIISFFLYLLIVIPWDHWVAQYNVTKILNGLEKPSVQLLAQDWGPKACLELIPLLEAEQLEIQRGTAALLLHKLKEFKYQVAKRKDNWKQTDFITERAVQGLEQVQNKMVLIVGKVPLQKHLRNLRDFSKSWY